MSQMLTATTLQGPTLLLSSSGETERYATGLLCCAIVALHTPLLSYPSRGVVRGWERMRRLVAGSLCLADMLSEEVVHCYGFFGVYLVAGSLSGVVSFRFPGLFPLPCSRLTADLPICLVKRSCIEWFGLAIAFLVR